MATNVAAVPPPPASSQEKTSRLLSDYLKGKHQQWKALYEKRPLTLLELPVDILRLIVKEARYRTIRI